VLARGMKSGRVDDNMEIFLERTAMRHRDVESVIARYEADGVTCCTSIRASPSPTRSSGRPWTLSSAVPRPTLYSRARLRTIGPNCVNCEVPNGPCAVTSLSAIGRGWMAAGPPGLTAFSINIGCHGRRAGSDD
jgi:hypothetical protein